MEEERITEDEAGLGRSVSDLLSDVGTLVRQEVELARCELAEKAKQAKSGATKLGLGGALGLVGAFVLSGAAVLGLTLLLQTWMGTLPALFISALVVGAILGVAAWLLLKKGGEEMSPDHLMPRRTLDSIKEDARWARRQV